MCDLVSVNCMIDIGMTTLLAFVMNRVDPGNCGALVVMAFPVSSFPNAYCTFVLDDFRKPYLKTLYFLQTGFPTSLVTIALLSTAGGFLIRTLV